MISALAVLTFWLVLRYNLHMFQQNGYKNHEHAVWLKKNAGRQALLAGAAVMAVICAFLPYIPSWAVLLVLFLIIIRYYLYLKKNNTKKKLVFTMRVRRQIVTDVVISVLIVAAVAVFLDVKYLPAAYAALVALQGIILIPVNVLNRPVEKAVSRHYINDAVKKLNAVENIVTIGVTGSYGKTSVKYYLNTLLADRFNVLITPESYNTPMGVVKTIRESLRPTHEIFICEMGAKNIGDIKEICDIVHPKHGIITSVGPQHLESFRTIENVTKTKFELFDALAEDGLKFANGDCEYITAKTGEYNNVITYSTDGSGSYNATDITLNSLGTEFDVTSPSGEREHFALRLVGTHNVINVLGAIAVANTLGISLKDLRVPVRRIKPVAHRMELIPRGNVTIIDDAYNSNPVGSKAAVETLKLFDGLRILVTPGMIELGEKEEEYNYLFGTYAAACCDYILLVGKKHTEPIMRGALDSGFDALRCIAYDRLPEALDYAYSINDSRHKFILLENDLPDNLA